jgi:TATA-binding protein-associated factor
MKRSAQSEPRQRDSLNNELVVLDTDESELQSSADDERPHALCFPFQQFCECMLRDMFDPHWETRHGATLALRVLFSTLGLALIQTPALQSDSSLASQWLEDIAVRLLCLAALDRFVDFVADTSVAPVRETCAQALSTIAQLMNPATINVVLTAICELCQRDEWDLRHSGFLCLKYVLAVRTDVIAQYLQPLLVPTIFKGLSDTSEDVLSVAALSTSMLIHHGSATVLEPISEHLWNALRNSCRFDSLESDSVSSDLRKSADLASAAASVLDCVTKIDLQFPSLIKHFDASVLCPLMANSSTCVRLSAIQLLKGVLTARELSMDQQMLSDLLCSVFQCALIETDVDLITQFIQGTSRIVIACSHNVSLFFLYSQFGMMCLLTLTKCRTTF